MIKDNVIDFIRKAGRGRRRIAFASIAAIIVLLATLAPIHVTVVPDAGNAVFTIGQGKYTITIGNLVAAQEADYTCDGTADDVEFQQALNALPSLGGQLFVYAGSYNWTASTTVTRAIDNVSIIGVGAAVYFDGDGSTPIFTAGGDRWVFSNLRTDAGGLEMGETSDWMWLNVFIGGTFYSVEAPDDPLGGSVESLDDIGDVNVSPSNKYILYWNNGAGEWQAQDISNWNLSELGTKVINDLDNINTSPSDQWLLYWNNSNSKWEAQALSNYGLADLGDKDLDDLDDVDVSSPSAGYFIYWDGGTSSWKCKALEDSDIPDAICRDTELSSHESDTAVHGERDPLYPPNLSCIKCDNRHQGLGCGILHIAGSNKTVIFWRDADTHDTDVDSVIKAVDTYDMGKTLINERTIYSEAGIDARGGAYAVMDDGRFGIILTRCDSGDTYSAPVFLYSDNEGVSWNSTVLTGKSALHPHRELIRYPTSVGGDDDGGWYTPAWVEVDSNNTKLVALYTTDNGENWSESEIISSATLGSGEYVSEPDIARIGAEDKWVMLWRRNQSANLNAYISKSTDLFTWSTPIDTGEELGVNPPCLHYYEGNLIWYAPSRWTTDFDNRITNQPANTLLAQVVWADDIWNDLTDWPGWTALASFPGYLTGYMSIQDIDGLLYGILCAGTYDGADLYLLTRDPGPTFIDTALLLPDIVRAGNFIMVPTNGGWSEFTAGDGAVAQQPFRNMVYITGTASGTDALLHTNAFGFAINDNYTYFNWDKKFYFIFNYGVNGSEADLVRRIQLKQSPGIGPLAEMGIGFQCIDEAMTGESYNTARGTVSLGDLELLSGTIYKEIQVVIEIDPGKAVRFYINGSLAGSITNTDYIPSGIGTATIQIVHSINRTGTGGANMYSVMMHAKMWQEF